MHEFYGDSAVRKCWEIIGSVSGENTLQGIDSALKAYFSSDLKTALKNYAVWRYFTGSRADSNHFTEGNTWQTSSLLRTHTSYPITETQGFENPQAPGGTNFIAFSNTSSPISLTFDGSDGFSWGAMMIGDRGTASLSFQAEMALSGSQQGSNNILKRNLSTLVLVPVNVSWPDPGGAASHSYTGSIASSANLQDTLVSQWNLLSVPNYVSNFSKTSLYPTATSSAYTGVPYAAYDTLQNGPGYWVKVPSSYNKTYAGVPYDLMWVPVNAGWNMVGSISGNIDTLKVFPSRGISRQSRFQAYNGSYAAVSTLKQGEGYWVKVSGSGYLTYNGTTNSSAPPPSSIDPNPPPGPGQISAPTLSSSVSNDHPHLSWTTVTGATEYRLYRYECEGAGDCDLTGSLRYQGTNTSYTDIQVLVGNKLDPTTVWYYVRAVDAFSEVSNKSNKKSFWKDNSYQEKVHLGHVGEENLLIPTEFSLAPNFPNPFNPRTNITYALPEPSYVVINIYNTFGQTIETLVNEFQSVGIKSVEFNASNLPSGVYFYRMQAGRFNDLKKMVLIK